MALVAPGGNSPGSYTFFEGTGGNDVVDLSAGSPLIVAGGAGLNEAITVDGGDDVVIGTAQKDTVLGGAGNDNLSPGDGNDAVEAGAANDTVNGGPGNDVIVGSGGNDTLTGGGGNDAFFFTDTFGNDTITDFDVGDTIRFDHPVNGVATAGGGALFTDGTNTVTLNGPNSQAGIAAQGVPLVYTTPITIAGVGAADPGFGRTVVGTQNGETINLFGDSVGSTVFAEEGADIVYGSTSSDVIYGGDGGDSLAGFAGNDTLLGGFGNDEIGGGDGNDLIDGGPGNDLLNGGPGNDLFFFVGNFGNDIVNDLTLGDTVRFDHPVNIVATGGGTALASDGTNTVNFTGPNSVAALNGQATPFFYGAPGVDPIL